MSKKEMIISGTIATTFMPHYALFSLTNTEERFGQFWVCIGLFGAIGMLFAQVIDPIKNYSLFYYSEGMMLALVIIGAYFWIFGERHRIKSINEEIKIQKKWKRLKAMAEQKKTGV